MTQPNTGVLWRRWVVANALGEMLGLGLTLGVGAYSISKLGDQASVLTILVAFLVAVTSGIIEATVVGLLQWHAMQPWFQGIRLRSWWLATLMGALAAYVMGYLPSTLMSLGEATASTQVPSAEPARWVVLLLAGGLGLAGGAVLSFAQQLTMRRTVRRASWWIPANMLAWLVGMPLIFLGIDVAQMLHGNGWIIVCMAGVLLVVGALVGAIHGAFLVRMVPVDRAPVA